MKYLPEADTIVALSTPLGTGAIAIIRISGPDSLGIVNPCLGRAIGPTDIRRAHFTEFKRASDHRTIDQVVATYFQAPASYTGEDCIEISCHCNPMLIDGIIERLVSGGARVAEPGEFTYRAFANGKMDLSQAEAVAALIGARSRQSATQSMRHLEGKLSGRVGDIREDILNYLSLLEVSLDFSDEDVELLPAAELIRRISATIERIEMLVGTFDYGRLLQEGLKLLILGKPNVGKSSMLNLLLQKERSIVSDIPGTTRDYIEAHLEIDGIAVNAVDTAGIRDTDDPIEAAGVARAISQLDSTDVAIAMFAACEPLTADDHVLMEMIAAHRETVRFVLALNKNDLGVHSPTRDAFRVLGLPLVELSVLNDSGLDALRGAIKQQLYNDESLESEEVVVTHRRHLDALQKTVAALRNAMAAVELGATEEIVAVDVRLALDCLGEITGETTSEDVLNHIFSSFCIGK